MRRSPGPRRPAAPGPTPAGARRVASSGSVGARPSRSAIQASSRARTSRSREASGPAFVAAIAAPIAGSPRASLVALAQPLAARPAAISQPGAAGSPGPPATASTSAAARTSGRWLIAATAASCSTAPIRTGRAPQAAASISTRRAAGSSSAGATTTHGLPWKSVASAAPKPLVSLPAIGWPPTNRRPRAVARSTRRAFVLATSVTTASGQDRGPGRTGQLVEQVEAGRGGCGEDHEVRPGDRVRDRRGCGVDEAGGQRPARPLAGRRPGDDGPPVGADGAGDRAADQAEAEDRDAHDGSGGPAVSRRSGARRAPRPPGRPSTRDPRAHPRGTARTPRGRSGRGRTG